MSDLKSKLAEVQRIIRKNLIQIQEVFPDFHAQVTLACDQLEEADGRAYCLMTQVNILVFADLCSQLDEAVSGAKVLVTDSAEFSRRFASRIAEVELYMDRLEEFLDAEQMRLLVHQNVRSAQLVAFLKERSPLLQSLLFELRFPYGKCSECSNPKARKHHVKCTKCFGKDNQPAGLQVVESEPETKVVVGAAPEMNAIEAAYIMAEAESAEKAKKRKKAAKRHARSEDPEFATEKGHTGRKGKRRNNEDW